ncbi:MAG: 2'-5' RNA ligase family protein [Clostridiales bacterium]|nr:2'-5' RNA ligase family protein [Clostridiales bacterium]
MAWAVILFFDENSEYRIRSLWDCLRIPGSDAVLYDGASRPHLSLAVLDSQDGTLEERVGGLAERTSPFTLTFTGLSAFPDSGVLYLTPLASGVLEAAYRDMMAALGPLTNRVWPLYLPGKWVPHTTVAMGLDERCVRKIRRAASRVFTPFTASCLSLGVVKFRPVVATGEYPLGGSGRENGETRE